MALPGAFLAPDVPPCRAAPAQHRTGLDGTNARLAVLVADAGAATSGLTASAGFAGLLGATVLRRTRRAPARRGPARQAVALRAAALLEYPGAGGVDDAFLEALLAAQTEHMGNADQLVLSAQDAKRLVEDVTVVLKAEATMQQVEFDELVVVGDIHGQFKTLLQIFDLAGRPSDVNPYLFNGDFVDRGKYSLEVILTMFALKLRYPGAVCMNRGNHEAVDMNLRYGFAAEIRDRYDEEAKDLFDTFSEAFRWLPLCHVVNREVLVVHGGLPGPDPRLAFADAGGGGTGYAAKEVQEDTAGRTAGRKGAGARLALLGYNPDNVSLPPRTKELTLAELAALPRGQEPATDLRALEGLPEDEAETQRLVVDLLWADPRGKTGFGPSFRVRKGCYIFGPDVTEKFLETNGLRLLIRSHEVKVKGYEWTHKQLITVFSASNYLGHARNKGAVVRLVRDPLTRQLEPTFIQYEDAEVLAPAAPAAA